MPSPYAGFNPRPRTGGDERDTGRAREIVLFQSAPPHGGRLSRGWLYGRRYVVSIRAPARGATRHLPLSRRRSDCFNPRPRTGGDRMTRTMYGSSSCFNPRPRTGGDYSFVLITTCLLAFQSAPPHGGRLDCVGRVVAADCVSIRAPARGATRRPSCWHHRDRVSIRAPARGATLSTTLAFPAGIRVSIRAPARGATLSFGDSHPRSRVSIRAPARGATSRRRAPVFGARVSIRAPARGATVCALTALKGYI